MVRWFLTCGESERNPGNTYCGVKLTGKDDEEDQKDRDWTM